MKQTADEILQKHEDANEMHFHQVDRQFIIEAMEEYAAVKLEKPINLEGNKTGVEWLVEQIKSDQNQKALSASEWMQVIEKAKEMEKEQIIEAWNKNPQGFNHSGEQYYNETYAEGKTL